MNDDPISRGVNSSFLRKGEKDLVSIIVPVFNAAGHLAVCLNSVLSQRYDHFEAWLIDDGSTDGSPDICDEYARRDSRIEVIHQVNSGVSAARNTGIQNARGSFVIFLDADDFLNPDSLTRLVETQKITQADLVIGNATLISSNGQRPGCRLAEDKLLDMQDIAYYLREYLRMPQQHDALFTCWGKLFVASIIREKQLWFNTDISCFEDVVFIFHYMRNIRSVAYLKDPLYNYLFKDSSFAFNISGHPRKIFGFFKSLPLMGEFLKGKISESEISHLLGNAYVTLAIIKMVHICRKFNQTTADDIYASVKEAVNTPLLRQGLPFYNPGRNGSRILPVLMKFKFIRLIIIVCRYKAYKRFGK